MFEKISNFINSVRESSGIPDEDFEEDYDDEAAESQEEKVSPKQDKRKNDDEDEDDGYDAISEARKRKSKKTGSNVVSIDRKIKPVSKIYIVTPNNFEEVKDIADMLIADYAIALNLESLQEELAQRIMDFMLGTLHSVNGKLQRVSRYVYLMSPENAEVLPKDNEELNKLLLNQSKSDE